MNAQIASDHTSVSLEASESDRNRGNVQVNSLGDDRRLCRPRICREEAV